MDFSVLILLVVILIIGVAIFFIIVANQGKSKKLNVAEYQVAWLKIENGFDKKNRLSYSMSIVEADKLLDQAMRESGIGGKTMGERLKRSGNRFSKIDYVWHAHKLRNKIAHEHGFQPTEKEALVALKDFKQALKDLGAI